MTALKRLFAMLAWAAVVVAVALLAVMVVIPRLTGWVPLTVLSGSMEPTIPVGSMVVVDRLEGDADLAEVEVGDVVTFMPRPQDPTLVTHRVVSTGGRADGSTVLVTKGDANGVNDSDPVAAEQARGLVRYHVPYAGYLSTALNVEQKQQGVVAVAGLLFVYAGVQVVRAVRGSRQGRTQESDVHGPAAATEGRASNCATPHRRDATSINRDPAHWAHALLPGRRLRPRTMPRQPARSGPRCPGPHG